MKLVMQINPLFHIQSCNRNSDLLEYSNMETIHLHYNGKGHWVTSSSIGNTIISYDSMNLQPTDEILNQATALYTQDSISLPSMEQSYFPYIQDSSTDCGLYPKAYAVDLAAGNNPSDIIYDHCAMHSNLSQGILENSISIFLCYQLCQDKNQYINCTKHIGSTKNTHFLKKLVLRNNLQQHHRKRKQN